MPIKLGRTKQINAERLSSIDDFRAQVNVTPQDWAYLYGPLADYSKSKARDVRTAMADPIVALLRREVVKLAKADPQFRAHVKAWLENPDKVDPAVLADAKNYVKAVAPGVL
jgi:hypothetical protein